MSSQFIMKHSAADPDSGCWVWSGGKGWGGYGKATLRNPVRQMLAHRASYLTFVGEIPDGLVVMHKCDNKLCVNPDHLTLGTQSDNIKDCSDKGRLVDNRGEKHGMAKLVVDDVIKIRSTESGNVETAKLFNINEATVRAIRKRKLWRHV